MEHTALTLLRKVAPRMIVVVEVHNLLAGTAHEQRASMNLLKFLSNQLKCAIVVLGTRDALAAMQTDAQIANQPIQPPVHDSAVASVKLRALSAAPTSAASSYSRLSAIAHPPVMTFTIASTSKA